MKALTPIFHSKSLHEIMYIKDFIMNSQQVSTFISNNQGVYKELGYANSDSFVYSLFAEEGVAITLPDTQVKETKEPTVFYMITSDVKSILKVVHNKWKSFIKKTKKEFIEENENLLKAS